MYRQTRALEWIVAYKRALHRKVDRRDLMEMEPW